MSGGGGVLVGDVWGQEDGAGGRNERRSGGAGSWVGGVGAAARGMQVWGQARWVAVCSKTGSGVLLLQL